MAVTVVMHDAAIIRMKSWNGEIGRATTRLANEIVYRQRVYANKRTGVMAARMHWVRKTYVTGIGFWAGSDAPYTLYPDQGTRPHPITPKAGSHLTFFWAKVGRVVWLKSVNHPGNRAYKFLERGMARGMASWGRAG